MRALTARQPWAWAIADGHKMVENRSTGWNTHHRGEVAVHASKAWSERGRTSPLIIHAWSGYPATDHRGRGPDKPETIVRGVLMHPHFDFGAVLAVVELVDVHRSNGCCQPWGEDSYVGADGELHRDATHLVFEEVRKLAEPVPCNGRLGLWELPPDVDSDVRYKLAVGL